LHIQSFATTNFSKTNTMKVFAVLQLMATTWAWCLAMCTPMVTSAVMSELIWRGTHFLLFNKHAWKITALVFFEWLVISTISSSVFQGLVRRKDDNWSAPHGLRFSMVILAVWLSDLALLPLALDERQSLWVDSWRIVPASARIIVIKCCQMSVQVTAIRLTGRHVGWKISLIMQAVAVTCSAERYIKLPQHASIVVRAIPGGRNAARCCQAVRAAFQGMAFDSTKGFPGEGPRTAQSGEKHS
jgi:hypothetical protein